MPARGSVVDFLALAAAYPQKDLALEEVNRLLSFAK
jgi:hypothetical protein